MQSAVLGNYNLRHECYTLVKPKSVLLADEIELE
jgi:hypothetical protein